MDFHNFYEYMMQCFDSFEGEKVYKNQDNQENLKPLKFEFFCTIDISMLKGDSKERTNCIIEEISDVDKY
ncbi:18082_t:CDS:1, partial [Cetraspora pellucida]